MNELFSNSFRPIPFRRADVFTVHGLTGSPLRDAFTASSVYPDAPAQSSVLRIRQFYPFRISVNRSLSFAVSSLVRFGIKSRSISTDNLGRLKTVRFIVVPPLSSRCSHIYSCEFRNSRIVLNRRTFSNVSRLNPYSRALASSSLLLYCGIVYGKNYRSGQNKY